MAAFSWVSLGLSARLLFCLILSHWLNPIGPCVHAAALIMDLGLGRLCLVLPPLPALLFRVSLPRLPINCLDLNPGWSLPKQPEAEVPPYPWLSLFQLLGNL